MISGVTFAKIFKDAYLINSKLTAPSIDIIFNQVKQKGNNKMNFEEFQMGIEMAI